MYFNLSQKLIQHARVNNHTCYTLINLQLYNNPSPSFDFNSKDNILTLYNEHTIRINLLLLNQEQKISSYTAKNHATIDKIFLSYQYDHSDEDTLIHPVYILLEHTPKHA